MLAIKNNVMADNAARHLGTSYDALAKSVERLSSGMRINSAKDDAAGLAVRDGLHTVKVHGELPLSPCMAASVSAEEFPPRTWTPQTFWQAANRLFLRKIADG